MDLFERATREKFRFETPRGYASVEDLWDLPLRSERGPSLDGIAIALHQELESRKVVSFVDASATDETTRLRFDVVLHVIGVRKAEAEAKLNEKKQADLRQKVLAVIAEREADDLRSKPLEELRAMINEA